MSKANVVNIKGKAKPALVEEYATLLGEKAKIVANLKPIDMRIAAIEDALQKEADEVVGPETSHVIKTRKALIELGPRGASKKLVDYKKACGLLNKVKAGLATELSTISTTDLAKWLSEDELFKVVTTTLKNKRRIKLTRLD